MAIRYGASALGLVSAMPSGPGQIPEEVIAQIARHVPPGVGSFLLTSERNADAIVRQHMRTHTTTLHLVDHVPITDVVRLRDALPGIGLVQVLHVLGDESVQEAVTIAPYVDALLLDSGNPHLAVKHLGGTGRTHDWRVSRRIVEAVSVPVFLAGGLRAENVAEAVALVRPFAVDVCSGVRTNGMLDERKLAAFVEQIV